MTDTGYDVIGDIHGHADELEALLAHLGYERKAGAWRHPDRKAVFLGDFIDRGPRQLDAVDIVRRMVDEGHAHAIMGNHEFNAIAWFLRDENGQPLRAHTEKNYKQHQAFLTELEGQPGRHKEIIAWFLTLPLWQSFDGFNVIHACWHKSYMNRFSTRLKDGNRLDRDLMPEAATKPKDGESETLFHAIEVWLKGLETPLPDGHTFLDKDKNLRHEVRVRWWDHNAVLYSDAALIEEEIRNRLPVLEIPHSARYRYPEDVPVFFGHYWMKGDPTVQSSKTACLDFSVAKQGKLVAYRWSGESTLSNNMLAHVPSAQIN